VEYNDGYECRIYGPKGTLSDSKGQLKRVIPHNPRPGSLLAKVTEEDLDRILTGGSKLHRHKQRKQYVKLRKRIK